METRLRLNITENSPLRRALGTLAACSVTLAGLGSHADESAVIDWIRANAIELRTVEAGNGFDDLHPLAAMIGEARIVGLGESTHGTREIFQMKHRLFEFLVEEMGFTIFGIEASYPDCLAINEYVLGGDVDPVAALNGQGFWTWDTEEVLDLIRWMRAYNDDAESEDKLVFYGYDIQNFSSAATRAIESLRDVDEAKAAEFEERLALLLQPGGFQKYQALAKPDRESLTAGAESLLAAVEESKDKILAASDNAAYRIAHRCAVVATQCEWMMRQMAAVSLNVDIGEAQRITLALPGHAKSLREFFESADASFLSADRREKLDALENRLQALAIEFINSEEDDPVKEWRTFSDDLARWFDERSESQPALDAPEQAKNAAAAGEVRRAIEIIDAQVGAMRNQINVRDVCIARNVQWIAEQHPGARIAIWAHNGHITEEGSAMGGQTLGSELDRIFGDDYFSIGFSFNQGAFQAIYQSADGQWDGKPALREHTVGVAPGGSIDRTFAMSGIERFIIDLRNPPAGNGVRAWFESPHPMRLIGAVYSDAAPQMYFAPVKITDHFDAITFIENTTRARPAPLTRKNFGIPD